MHSRLTLLLASIVLALFACGKTPPGDGKPASSSAPTGSKSASGNRPQAVQTMRTHLETVPIILEVQGSIVALDEVELRAQRNGTIQDVLVTEGSEVRQGQVLFTLDAREDAANVRKAEAAVAGAETALSIARRDLARNQDLAQRNFISPAALDTFKSKVETAESALAQSKAVLEQTVVTHSYTRITAPFAGRAGRVDARPGTLVTAGATSPALVKLTRMHPIGVSFALPERDLPGLLAAQATAPVKITVSLGNATELNGQVSFIESAVDRSTGTISVKARLDNTARAAWPGQYARVRLATGQIDKAVVLPAQAVINNPSGRLVYVVQDDATVRAQPVEVVRIFEQKAVVKGLDADLKIVLEGAQNLRPGAKISEIKRGEGKNPAGGANSAPAASNNVLILPEGFTPRDPERWASASDEQKRAIIARWQAQRGTAGDAAQ